MLVSLFLFSAQSFAYSSQAANCVSAHYDEEVSVKYVIDGDTVVLTDNRHIRLIGINTPEISHNNKKASEPGAELARQHLIQLLDHQSNIQLLYGKERLDKYGRTLAHIYLVDGSNIQAELLRQGLAMPLRIAPNLSLVNCYNDASLSAKKEKRGLWAMSRYKTHDVSTLSGSEKGFYFISGKVTKVSESRSSLWISLKNNVALRIHKADLDYFNKNDLMSLRGKTVEANGWLYKNNKQLRMSIRHKLDLNILD